MHKYDFFKGDTSQTIYVHLKHSTTGQGLTGLAFNTASLVAYYTRALSAATAITLATQTVTGAYSSGGFVEVSSANAPGLYRLDLPDAVLATGVGIVNIVIKGAANLLDCSIILQLYDTGLSTQAKTDVNAEVVDALATDTYAEPAQGAPAATASLSAKINYLYKAWRNKKDNNGTETKLYADDGTTVHHKQATTEAAGTVTAAEWISGP